MNMQSENLDQLATALAKAQGEIKPALKDSNNPYYNSKYADLNSVWVSCREPLSRNQLSVIQTISSSSENMDLITTLVHSSGQWIKSCIPISLPSADTELDKYGKTKKINKLQLLGSTLTYLRRYALSCIVGISTDEDDDGNIYSEQENNKNDKKNNISTKLNIEIKMTTKENWLELNKLLDSCDIEFSESVNNYLRSIEVCSFSDMDFDLFEKIRNKCIKHISEKK